MSSTISYTYTPFFISKLAENWEEQAVRTYYKADKEYLFPDPDVIQDGEKFIIYENEPDERFSVTQAHPLKTRLTLDDIEKLPHDLVLSLFRNVTDRDLPFKHFFPLAHDGRDSSSPDVIFTQTMNAIFLEVGTTQGREERSYEQKVDTYRDAIQVRCGSLWQFYVLIVSRSRIVCNFTLTKEECELIFMRYTYGMIIKQKAKDTGLKLDHDDETSRIKEEIKANLFDSINKEGVDTTDFLFIDETSLQNFDDVPEVDYMRGLLDDAKDDFMKQTDSSRARFDVDSFIKENYQNENKEYKNNLKPVVPFPALIISDDELSINKKMMSMDVIENDNGPYSRFWAKARMNMGLMMNDDEENNVLRNYRTRDTADYTISSARKGHKDEFYHRGRIIADINYEDSLFFAERGYHGKKFKDNVVLKNSREQSKKGFSWDVDCSDIERFITRDDLFKHYSDVRNPILDSMKTLFMRYFENIKSHSAQKFKNFLSTKIGMFLTFITTTASEINLNIRKPTSGNEWIITYNRLFKFPIAIHNTGSNKHTLFMMLVEKHRIVDNIDLPFTPMIDLGNYMCSPLLSTRNHDLSMHVGILTKFYSTYITMTDVCNESPVVNPSFRFNAEVLTSLLISMENKEQTSAPLQNVRYMYMDLLSTSPVKSDPFKVITKFNKILRSRLIVYLMKKIVTAFKIMSANKEAADVIMNHQYGKDDEDSDEEDRDPDDEQDVVIPTSQDQVGGLISWISMKPLKTYEEALNLSYMGVFHEKDKSEEKHGFLKIFEKVITEELKMDQRFCNKYRMGFEPQQTHWPSVSPSDLKSHEFSVPHVKMIGKAIKSKLATSGVSQTALKDLILEKLSKVCYEELATFKASAEYSAFTSGDLPYFGYKAKKRRKCLSAILSLMEEIGATSRCPFSSFKKLFGLFKIHGGLIANLFKKNQLTGVREIFVLYIHARVVVNFLETVSRTLCELMPNEYLTKGTEKLSAVMTHYGSVSSELRYKIAGASVSSETISDSADATTWCQRFIMPVFSVMFNEIFGDNWKEMNHTLQSILNEVTFKRLELPVDLLTMFFNNQDIYSPCDQGINELKRQFLTHQEHDRKDLNDGFSMFLKNRSNFMQGILHYTSSLVHSGHLLLFSRWVSKLTEMRFGKEVKAITTTLCSSDDATRITTLIFKKKDPMLHKRVIMFLIFTSSLLKASYPLFTAKLSEEKSTLAVLTKVAEFNSVWFFRNTMLTPKIKWSFAAMQYKVSSSPVERQLQDHNLLRDLMANGASTVTCNDVQIACLVNHYDCLGMFTTDKNVFSSLLNEIVTISHPIGWFYFLSNPKTSAALGYQHTKYYNLKLSRNARICELISRKSLIGETSDIGGRSYSVKMRVGSSHNYFKFINSEIKVDKRELEQMMQDNIESLFSKSIDLYEERIKILMKAHAPGSEKSFSFDSGSKQHSMASYIINKPCITVSSKDEKFKCSLAYLTDYIINMLVTMTDDDFKYTYAQFPQMDMYDRLEQRLKDMSPMGFTIRNRKMKTKIKLPKSKIENLSPLKDVLSTHWFGKQPRSSRTMQRLSLESYLEEFPWIRNDFHSSLEEFKNQFGDISLIEFVSFIMHTEEREPTIEILHPGRKKNGAVNTLVECLAKNYSRDEILTRLDRRSDVKTHQELLNNAHTAATQIQSKLDEIETWLARAKTIYSEPERKLLCSWALSKQNIVTLEEISDDILSRIERRSQPLLIMSCIQAIENKPSDRQIMIIRELYKKMNQGMLVWYKKEQKKVQGKYIGNGLIDITFPTATITLMVKSDEIVTEIFASRPGKVNFYSAEIASLMSRNLKLKTRLDDGSNNYVKTASFELIGKMGKYRENSKKGTPIRSMTQEVLVYDDVSFSLDLNRSSDLILKIHSHNINGESIRFSAKTKLDSLSAENFTGMTDLKDFNKDWLNGKTIGPKAFKSLLSEAEEDETVLEWLQTAVNSRLMAMGETVSNKTALGFDVMMTSHDYDMDIMMEDAGIMEDEFAEMEFLNMADNIDYEELNMYLENTHEDTETFLGGTDYMEIDNPELFNYNRDVIRVTSKNSYFFSCCSFDAIIRGIQKSYKMKLSDMYVSGYPERVRGDALRLVRLLGMKPEEIEEEEEDEDDLYDF